MKVEEIKRLLKEQPDSYLHLKDFNTFDTSDLHCLKKGITVRNTPVKRPSRSRGKRTPYEIEVTFEGVTNVHQYQRQVSAKYGITKSMVEYGLKHGHTKKGEILISKIFDYD